MKIVCPTDFSPNSISALHYIKSFAADMGGAHLDIISTYNPVKHAASLINMDKVLAEQTEKEFINLKHRHFDDLPPNISIKTYHNKGNATDLILSLTKKKQAELIALGTKGMTALKNIFVGSVTKDLIKKSTCPLLIIPPETEYKKFENIALAIRDEHINHSNLFDVLVGILSKTSAKLHLIHVDEGEGKTGYDPEIQRIFNRFNHSFIDLEQGNVLEQVNKYCQDQNIDMLCLIHKHRGQMEHIFGSSLSIKQLYMLEIPHLVLIMDE